MGDGKKEKKSNGKGRRAISDNRTQKRVSTSYNAGLPVPSDPFESLPTLLRQALASKDMYNEAMAIHGGMYDKTCKGAPILDQLQVGLKAKMLFPAEPERDLAPK